MIGARAILCRLGRNRRLSRLADGEMTGAEARAARDHLDACEACRASFDRVANVSRLVSALPCDIDEPASVPTWVRAAAAQRGRSPRRTRRPSPGLVRVVGASAIVAIVAVSLWLALGPRESGWAVARSDGAGASRLAVGQWLVTDAASRAVLTSADVGRVTVEPGSRIQLVAAGRGGHRLSLERGKISGEIIAPARVFSVDTPSALAVDLGCAFTLDVDDAGTTTLRVTSGWVALERDGRSESVPAGTVCIARRDTGPGTPFRAATSETFKKALERFDFGADRGAALKDVMHEARYRDALSLVSLVSRVDERDRRDLYYALATFVPPPEGVTRDGVLRADTEMLARWRRDCAYVAAGLDPRDVPPVAGQMTEVGSLATPRRGHAATLLGDGRVLVTGGIASDGTDYGPPFLADAEAYVPEARAFAHVGPMTAARAWHTATRLQDGRVLLAGGASTATAEVFDPATNRFGPTGALNANRSFHTATLLGDGRVLIAGGDDEHGRALATAEIYDPATGTFTEVGAMGAPRRQHAATLLADGRVLVTGGARRGPYPNPADGWAAAEIFDPATGRFEPTGTMAIAHAQHAALRLADGRVLVVGGVFGELPDGIYPIVEVFDPTTGAFSRVDDLGTAHFKMQSSAAMLRDGRVVVAGGGPLLEVYDPRTGLFSTLETDSVTERYYATATALDDGDVLIAGGSGIGVARRADAWLFHPDTK